MSPGKIRLLNNSLFLSILQGVNLFAPLVLLPYMSRILGVKEFGAVMAAMATVYMGFIITDYGFSLSATYRISKSRNDKRYISDLLSKIFTAKVFLLIFALIVLFAISIIPTYYEYRFIFWAGSLSVISQAYQPLWLFMGIEKMGGYTVYMVAAKLIYVFMVLFMVDSGGDGAWVLFSWSCANTIGTIISLYMVRSLGFRIGFSSIKESVKEVRSSAEFFWSRISVVFYTSASSIIVGTVNLHEAAMYSSAEQGYKAGQAVTSSITQAMYPFMAKEKNWNIFLRVTAAVAMILVISAAIIGYFSEFFITLVFGQGYLAAASVLPVMMMTLVINYLGVSFGYPALSAFGKVEWANKTVMIASIVFVGLCSILYLRSEINALNMAWLVLVIELFVFISRFVLVIRFRSCNE